MSNFFEDFRTSVPGRSLQHWEEENFALMLPKSLLDSALQIGTPSINTLTHLHSPQKLLVHDDLDFVANATQTILLAQPEALPFKNQTFDLVTLVHTLEFSKSPNTILSEIFRILKPNGKLILSALNPFGLWSLQQKFPGSPFAFLKKAQPLSSIAIKALLQKNGFELDAGRFGVYEPLCHSNKIYQRFDWLNRAGDRWAPQCSNVLLIKAKKNILQPAMLNNVSLSEKLFSPVPKEALSEKSVLKESDFSQN